MIDNELIDAYIAELEALRRYGTEMAESHPAVASRLDIGPRPSRDPAVERLVQSAAFLAARLRLAIEGQATEMPLALLTILAPSLVEPVPSMAVVSFEGGSEPRLIRRGTRVDYQVGGQALVCLSTTMDVYVGPATLNIERLPPTLDHADGLSVTIVGDLGGDPLFMLGHDRISGATLLDALSDSLTAIEVQLPSGEVMRLPPTALRLHGLARDEAALPAYPATHRAHRLVVEYMVFPEKFRFVSLPGIPLLSGSQIRFFFSAALPLQPGTERSLLQINRVPVVNLWRGAGTPFEVTGRIFEHPVRVDALRYRTVECHSVLEVGVYEGDGSLQVIDPVVAPGNLAGSEVRWGTRRTVSRVGGEVLLYFQGIDYMRLGNEQLIAVPQVWASNRDIAERAPVGAALMPVDAIGDWRCVLTLAPTRYREALTGAAAMRTLIGYLRSSIGTFGPAGRARLLRDYLKMFPGSEVAPWIEGIDDVGFRPVAVNRGGDAQPGLVMTLSYDRSSYRTVSQAMMKRIVNVLMDSQRGLNRVEEVIVTTV